MPSLHSGISASAPVESLGLRRILRYYHSRSPCSTTFHSGAISPRSRPTESGSARAYLRLRFARYRLVTWLRFGGFLIHSFSGRGEVGRKIGERKDKKQSWSTDKQSPFDRKILNRSSIGNFNFAHLSLSFGSLPLC